MLGQRHGAEVCRLRHLRRWVCPHGMQPNQVAPDCDMLSAGHARRVQRKLTRVHGVPITNQEVGL